MGGDAEVDDPASVMSQHQEYVKDLEPPYYVEYRQRESLTPGFTSASVVSLLALLVCFQP